MKIQIFIRLCVIAICVSCRSSTSQRRADGTLDLAINKARMIVLEMPSLDDTSRAIVKTETPKVSIIRFPFGGNYTYSWIISSNKIVQIEAINGASNLNTNSARIRVFKK